MTNKPKCAMCGLVLPIFAEKTFSLMTVSGLSTNYERERRMLMILGFTIIGFGIGYIVVAILNESRKGK